MFLLFLLLFLLLSPSSVLYSILYFILKIYKKNIKKILHIINKILFCRGGGTHYLVDHWRRIKRRLEKDKKEKIQIPGITLNWNRIDEISTSKCYTLLVMLRLLLLDF